MFNNDEYIQRLENVIRQMLRPLKDIPINLVIEAITGEKVISYNSQNKEHKAALILFKQAAVEAGNKINKSRV